MPQNVTAPKVEVEVEVEVEDVEVEVKIFVQHNICTDFLKIFLKSVTLNSILKYSSTSIHFIVLTDKASAETCGHIFFKIIGKRLSQDIIMSRFWKWRRLRALKPLHVSFVNLKEIVSANQESLQEMKTWSWQSKDKEPDKELVAMCSVR
ncbi:uncharacterized protein LOC111700814 [Eurytemora carolleeae]|uniref:uncharacterized protein LOC111700814 n=1 Tax=Eurytemora carolleeae TaxID=1294199 RepID=UPI000C7799A1|nr:uncharacterized protein LOC111700814 [Eurytemora carolleeae]|eukprot:XP_023327629.1 uncharacterized protein LOC111700814 [Eurytemora affinis]